MKDWKLDLITKLIAALLKMLKPEMLVSAVDAMLDKVEDLVAESGTPIDDLLVMPLITLIRDTFNIPDDD